MINKIKDCLKRFLPNRAKLELKRVKYNYNINNIHINTFLMF